MKRASLLICLLAICIHNAVGQQPTLRNFSTADYNGGTQNWCIDQTPEGIMLFGNNNGLLVFDGNKWKTKYVANYSVVRAVLYDKKYHRIYAGASNEFGYFEITGDSRRMAYHSLSERLPEDKRKFGEIWNIWCVGDKMAFQSKNDIFVVDRSGGITIVNNGHRIETSGMADGRLLVACKEGIYYMAGSSLRPLGGTEALRGKTVRAIMKAGNDVLFATAASGVYAYDGKSAAPYVMDITPFLEENQIFCATRNSKYIAFGTVRGGLVIKNLKTGKTSYANIGTGMMNNTVLSARFDNLDNIWLGLDNGIGYVLNDMPYRDLLGARNHTGTGYASVVHDGKLYLGTNQGLFVTDYPIPESPYPPALRLLHGMTGQVWNLTVVEGTLLCGTDNGAYVIDGMSAEKVAGADGTWNFEELRKHPGHVLACDYNGFFIMQRRGTGYVVRNRLKGFNEVTAGFHEDSDGSIWASHWQKGIFRFKLDKGLEKATAIEFFNKGNGLVMDENNILCEIGGKTYVSAVDGLYSYKDGKLGRDDKMSALFNTFDQPLRIIETPGGDLWAYKDKYVALARKGRDGRYMVDSMSFREAAKNLQMSSGNIGFLDSAHTMFNTNNGFCIMSHLYKGNAANGKTMIREVTSTNAGDSMLYSYMPAGSVPEIKIPHGLNSIRIEFVQPEYRDDKAVTFSCFLENYDKNWTAEQVATSKEYTRLPKGKYVFNVRARNSITGKTEVARMRIEILPAWYETWWAYMLYVLMALMAIRLVVAYLKRRADRELVRVKAEKERQQKEQQQKFEIENAKKEKELVQLRNSKLEIELKHKAGELADSTMNLIRKNDMLKELDESMDELSENVRGGSQKTEVAKKISDIRRSIRMNMNDDGNWDKFEQNFNMVYDNFMMKLMAEYPNLKTSDKKLCAYLRMGLSCKEMASLLNTSVRSIETARYRLRKKLDLESGDNLMEFIQGFEKNVTKLT